MGILRSKDKVNSSTVSEVPKEVRSKHIELFGREFRIIREGLDPEEVITFLETAAGSSDDAFKRLEQFTAFQSVAKTMGESIVEAKQLAEHAKSRARVEAQQEKVRAIEEVKGKVSTILDQTMRSCVASVDSIHSVLLEAIARSQEIQQEAYEKTREMVAINLAETRQNIQDAVDGHWRQLDSGLDRSADMPPDLLVESVDARDTIGDDEVDDGESEDGPALDLANLQESLMSLEESLFSLEASKSAFEQTPKAPTSVLEEEDEEHPPAVESKEHLPDVESLSQGQRDTVRQYSGEVIVEITGGAEESWMQQLRHQILNLSGVRIRAESGVDERTTVVSLSLDEPTTLLPVFLSLPRVSRVVQGRLNGGSSDGMRLKLWPRSQKSAQQIITVELDENGLTPASVLEADNKMISAG